jgi:small conductance mechanosensitive channel
MDVLTSWLVEKQPIILQGCISLVTAFLALWLGFKASNFISAVMQKIMQKRGVDYAVAVFAGNFLQIFLKLAVLIAVLAHVGIETSSFIAVLGAAGLAIGLSLQGSLANFASGILIITFRPFKTGDFVEVSGVSGSVREIQIFSTILTTPDNRHVVVPNAQVTGGPIVNYSRHETRRIDMTVGVSYDADLKKTEQVLKAVLDKHPLVLVDPVYTVGVSALGDSSVNFVVRPWVLTSNYWPVQFELNQQIKAALDEAGIGIPFPQMDVHLHQNKA